MKALLHFDEAERLKALAKCKILATGLERDFGDITFAASQEFGTPIALINLVDRNRQWLKSKIGMTESETSRDIASALTGFCNWTYLMLRMGSPTSLSPISMYEDVETEWMQWSAV